jgi:hypothetical protein
VIDVVCYYADLGRPYQPLMERMCASAHAVMDCRTVIMTPTPRDWMGGVFDTVVPHQSLSYKVVNRDNLCQQRAEAMMSWGALCNRETIFVDPDLEFRAAPRWGDWDIGLLWRKEKMAMPVNTGAILCRPGFPKFWERYGNTAVNLPARIHGWWCDQIGFSVMLGSLHEPGAVIDCLGARVALLNAADNCHVPKAATSEAWAIHLKGKLKGDGFADVLADDFAASHLSHLRVTA